jgi:hypothetical protein
MRSTSSAVENSYVLQVQGETKLSAKLDTLHKDFRSHCAKGSCGSVLGDVATRLPRQQDPFLVSENSASKGVQGTRTGAEVDSVKHHPAPAQDLLLDDAQSQRMRKSMIRKAYESESASPQTRSTATQTTLKAPGLSTLHAPSSMTTVPECETVQHLTDIASSEPGTRVRKKEENSEVSLGRSNASRTITMEDQPRDIRNHMSGGATNDTKNSRWQPWRQILSKTCARPWANLQGRMYRFARKIRRSSHI